MRVFVAEDDPATRAALTETLRQAHYLVRSGASVREALAATDDCEVLVLDVHLADGTAWDVLDAIPSTYPPFRVLLLSGMERVPPARWAHLPLYMKPIDVQTLLEAVERAPLYFRSATSKTDAVERGGSGSPLARAILAPEPPLAVSIPVAVAALTLTTLLMWLLRENAPEAASGAYTVVVLLIAAWAGVPVGVAAALVAFAAFNFFMVPPYYTFRVATLDLGITLFAFLASAVVGAVLVGCTRQHARRERLGADETRLRYRILLDSSVQPGAALVAAAVRTMAPAVPGGDVVFVDAPDQEPWWATAAGLATAWAERRTVSRQVDDHEVLLLPVAGQDGIVGILAVRAGGSRLSDTERRLLGVAATELGRLHERAALLDAAAASDRVRASDDAKTALLAAVSHDLRTPLGAIKVTISALLEQSIEIPPARARDLLETADREVDRLTSMIDHLLDLSRFEAGAFRLARDRVSIAELLAEAITRVEIASGRPFESDVASDLNVEGDSVRLLEAVTNVLDNAARYSTPPAPISVRASRGADGVTIRVADRGPGLTRPQRERLFQPFWRGEDRDAGSGLGLAISRSILAAHGGSIDLESHRGAGTTVTIVLPERPPA